VFSSDYRLGTIAERDHQRLHDTVYRIMRFLPIVIRFVDHFLGIPHTSFPQMCQNLKIRDFYFAAP